MVGIPSTAKLAIKENDFFGVLEGIHAKIGKFLAIVPTTVGQVFGAHFVLIVELVFTQVKADSATTMASMIVRVGKGGLGQIRDLKGRFGTIKIVHGTLSGQ